MLGRQVRRLKRYPELTVIVVAIPLIFMLLFVYVFGSTLGAGLTPGGGNRGDYANYVVPAILVMTIGSIAAGTTTTVAMDMTTGIIARFRSMSISPGSVLVGHALGAPCRASSRWSSSSGWPSRSGFARTPEFWTGSA